MRRYLETFSRHKIALILPVVIAVAISAHQAMGKPHKYESSMNIWFDTAASAPSSLQAPQMYTTPESQDQPVLQEFLDSPQFLVDVGRAGPLAGLLTGGHPDHETPAVKAAVDDEIAGLLSKAFTISPVGPQVAAVTMTGPSPSYLPGTLAAVYTVFKQEITANSANHSKATVAYYQNLVSQASQWLSSARSQASTYKSEHPQATTALDSQYSGLVQAAQQAQTNYGNLQGQLQQAQQSVANATSAISLHVQDAPMGVVRISNKKHEIFTVVAGLLAGLVISILALSALTALDKTARRQEDIEGVAGMEVVASIRELPRGTRLPGIRKARP